MIGLQMWTPDDVPSPPYFHGSRSVYNVGDWLHVDEVNPLDPDEDRVDERLMCFATTCFRSALQWAFQRRIRSSGGLKLRVYQVGLLGPEVDTNAEGFWKRDHAARSVMAPLGVIDNRCFEMDEGEYDEVAMLEALRGCPEVCNVDCGSHTLRLDQLSGP